MNHTAISPVNAAVGRQKPAPASGTERTSPIRSLRSTLASEWIKLRTLRSTAALLGLTTVVGGLVVAGLTRAAPDLSPTIAEGLAYPVVFSAVFAAVAGISMFTSDIQHGTLEPTLIAQPSRTTIAAAKVLIAAAFGTAVAGLSQVGGLAGGFIAGTELGDLSTIAQRALWAMLFVSLASIIGLGVGMLARHSAAAISGLLDLVARRRESHRRPRPGPDRPLPAVRGRQRHGRHRHGLTRHEPRRPHLDASTRCAAARRLRSRHTCRGNLDPAENRSEVTT